MKSTEPNWSNSEPNLLPSDGPAARPPGSFAQAQKKAFVRSQDCRPIGCCALEMPRKFHRHIAHCILPDLRTKGLKLSLVWVWSLFYILFYSIFTSLTPYLLDLMQCIITPFDFPCFPCSSSLTQLQARRSSSSHSRRRRRSQRTSYVLEGTAGSSNFSDDFSGWFVFKICIAHVTSLNFCFKISLLWKLNVFLAELLASKTFVASHLWDQDQLSHNKPAVPVLLLTAVIGRVMLPAQIQGNDSR
jgi:hypothetical protein